MTEMTKTPMTGTPMTETPIHPDLEDGAEQLLGAVFQHDPDIHRRARTDDIHAHNLSEVMGAATLRSWLSVRHILDAACRTSALELRDSPATTLGLLIGNPAVTCTLGQLPAKLALDPTTASVSPAAAELAHGALAFTRPITARERDLLAETFINDPAVRRELRAHALLGHELARVYRDHPDMTDEDAVTVARAALQRDPVLGEAITLRMVEPTQEPPVRSA